MPRDRSTPGARRLPAAAGLAAALAMALGAAACGGDGDAAGEPREAGATSAETVTETTAEPPPETAPSGDASATTGDRSGDSTLAEDAVTGPQSCPDVVITPNSGNGLFDVQAEGLTCEDATAALEAWGTSGYPGDSPAGFSCEELSRNADGSARLRCEQGASGAVLEFDTGG